MKEGKRDSRQVAEAALYAADDSGSNATFVLVHGAWHGGWCWGRVAQRLRAAGHHVFHPTQTGLGERRHLLSPDLTLATFVDDIAGVIEYEELDDVILVGHSFAGSVIRGVAGRLPERLRHLVYLDALIVTPGTTPFDSFPEEIVTARRKLAEESSGGLSLPPPLPSALGVIEPKDSAWLARRMTPQPLRVFETKLPSDHFLGDGVPRTYVACTAPRYEPFARIHREIERSGEYAWEELQTGHDAMVTAPALVAELLDRIARESST